MPARERFRAKEERERRRLAEAKSRDIARKFRNKKALGAKEREKATVGPKPAAESLSKEIADKLKRTKEIENPKDRDRRNEEVRRLHFEEGLTQEEVAKRLGVSVHTIYRTFKKQGWEPRHSTRKWLEASSNRYAGRGG
jgi:DNA-directed RNA polymerase specialized sigma subunit